MRMIDVTVNGQARAAAEGATVAQLLEQLRLQPHQVVVEVNLEIIKREQRAATTLRPGDVIEIVRFVGGGRRGRP